MLKIVPSNHFKRDLKLAKKRGYDISLLQTVIDCLVMRHPLDTKYRDHELSGDYIGFRECHILYDWLLVYRIENDTCIMGVLLQGNYFCTPSYKHRLSEF